MASILNSTFSRVFTEEGKTYIPTPSNIFQGPDEEKLIITEIQAHDLRKYLQKIDPNKSVGPDEILPRLLKECCARLETPITGLFNKLLTQARVPRACKRPNIFKTGEKKQAINYRPISLTSVLIKLFEKIIKDKTIEILKKNKLITGNQYGFCSNKSCLTNLFDFFNDVYASWDVREPYDVIYLNFQKAFDKVPHKRRIPKLRAHGIAEHLCGWIED